jgi:NAD(P)H dehydrogenase (quinone)
MRVHVNYAHPLADSFAAALHARIVAALRRSGHQVDDCDLYGEGFNPVLTAAERRSYNTQSPDLAAVAPYVARLQAAEALVLCFPTWWYGMPAILVRSGVGSRRRLRAAAGRRRDCTGPG